jgi:hypothetical protein
VTRKRANERKVRPGRAQVSVLALEPKRGALMGGCIFMAVLAGAVVASALAYQSGHWPDAWSPDDPIPSRTVAIVAGVAGIILLLFLIGAVANGRRWHTSRAVERMSNDAALAAYLPDLAWAPPTRRAAAVPALEVQFVRPAKLPKVRTKLQRVSPERNIVGRRPLRIAYLRLFENEPRIRTFVEGAWREFGYVVFLRSAASVTPAEYRAARATGGLSSLFISSHEQLLAACDGGPRVANPKGRYRFKNASGTAIRVRDRYGSYPLTPLLCHGAFWKAAVDDLLARVDLVVLDLSGFRPENAGTRHELQRVVDRFPVERVVMLADPHSNQRFLDVQLHDAWSQMADGSPNAGTGRRTLVVAVTDYFARVGSQDDSGPSNIRLTARRKETRRVAVIAQDRADASAPGAPASG